MSDQTQPGPDLWTTVDTLTQWLDANRPIEGREGLLLRILSSPRRSARSRRR
jgi:hypothetical protein